MTRKPEVVLGVVGAMMLALGVGAATSGLSTQQARTAAPSTVDGTQSSNSEGSSLAFARADHTHATTFLSTLTGAIARTFASKFGDTVSVKDFGAKGDGSTDDTAAIQAACTAASANLLVLPAGTYPITTNVTCAAATAWFQGGAKLAITAGKTFTASGRVISLGGDPTTGTGTITYSNAVNFFANDNGFSFGTTPSTGVDDFFHIRRDYPGSSGIIIRNDDATSAQTDTYIHLYGGPLSGPNQGANMRISTGNLLNNGGLVNIIAEHDAVFSLIQQADAPLDLYTSNVRQLQVASIPSAVNYWVFKGGVAAGAPSIGVAGADTNVSMSYLSKGSGSHFFRTGAAFSFQLEVKDTAGATNRAIITGSNGGAPSLATSGGNLALAPATNIVTAPSLSVTSTTGGGSITLAAGTGTATVNSGARCVCSDSTANASCKASVSTTTLTVTGTGTDVVNYFCF